MKIMDADLTRGGVVVQWRRCTLHVEIVKMWWQQHISDVDGGATRTPGLEFQGESLG